MSSMNLLSTTADGQQVFLTSAGQHILTTTTDPNIIFSENPNKTIVLHDSGVVDNVDQATGVEYTLIEDQSGGGLLQIAAANAGGQSSGAGNIVLSQDFFDVIDNVDLQHSFPNEVIEKKLIKKDFKLEKPIGKGPYFCDQCPTHEGFLTWPKYKKHVKSHEEDKKHKCPKCASTFNLEKNLTLHIAAHRTDNFVCPICDRKFNRYASFRSHLTIHEEEDNLSCNLCEALFTHESALNRHVAEEHTDPVTMNTTTTFAASLPSMLPPQVLDAESMQLKFSCKICKTQLKTLKEYQNHMDHHSKLKYMLKLKQKKKRKTTDSVKTKFFKNTCKTCNKKFQKPSQLVRHERTHTGEKPFQCEHCKKAFNQKNTLDLHLRKHTGEKPYKCDFCQMAFTQAGNLRSHIKRVHSIETDEPLIKCELCSCTFKKMGSLHAHFSRVHNSSKMEAPDDLPDPGTDSDLLFKALNSTGLPSINPEENNRRIIGSIVIADKANNGKKHLVKVYQNAEGQKIYPCNFCAKEFKKPYELGRHLRVHTLEKPFKCRICPRAFAVKTALNSHSKIHTAGGRDHLCSVCLKRFSTKALLRAHQKTHLPEDTSNIDVGEPLKITENGMLLQQEKRFRAVYQPTRKELVERKYRCNSCNARFKKMSHLKAHALRHTGEKPFRCELCDKLFVSRGGLTGHTRNFHDETEKILYQCLYCPATFSTKGSTHRHINNAHKKERPFICPICSKSFKTKVLCKKHMKIHRNDLALKNPAEVQQAPPTSTIEHSDIDKKAEFFTADEQGTVTLSNFSTSNQIIKHLNIASDGTITLEQNDLNNMDLSNLQFSTTNNEPTIFQLPHIIKKCSNCNEMVEENMQHNCLTKTHFCSFKKCNMAFASEVNLQVHMDTYHQPPFNSPMKKSTVKKVHESKSVTFKEEPIIEVVEDDKTEAEEEENTKTISQIIFDDSLKEVTRISTLKDQGDFESGYPNKCSICPRSFKKPSDLIRHIRTHTKEKPYKCDECGKAFTVVSTLNTHKKIHLRPSKQNAPDAIKCHLCSKTFLSKNALKTHMRLHTGAKPFECPICKECFRTSGHRKNHMTQAHQEQPSVQNIVKEQRIVPSKIVTENPVQLAPPALLPSANPGTSLSIQASSLTQALESVSVDGKPIIGETLTLQLSDVPGMEFAQVSLQVNENLLSQLQRGQNINLVFNQEPNPVFINETDRTNHILNSHQPVFDHEGPLEFDANQAVEQDELKTCPVANCRKSFAKPSMLQRHMRIHTGERPFPCELCNKAFNQKNALKIHMRKHDGVKDHHCPFCKLSFTQKGNLKTHIQRSHADQAKIELDAIQQNKEIIVMEPIIQN